MEYSSSSLSFWLSLSSANLLYRGFSPVYPRVKVALFPTGQSALGWLLEDVRVWKLNRKYPSEKSFPFSLPTQGCYLSTLKPSRHLLATLNIPVGMEALYEGTMTHSFQPAQKLWCHLSQNSINIILKSIYHNTLCHFSPF